MQPSNTTTILNKCRTLNDQISSLRQKRETQLHLSQQALLDSSSSAEDQHARQNLDYAQSDITASFRRIRVTVNELKNMTPADHRVRTQMDTVRRNLEREIAEFYKMQREFDGKLRDQVRRRYEISNPDASPEEVDSGVQNVLMGQEQIFQVQGARSRQAKDAQAAVMERSAAIRQIEQDLIALAELSQEVAEMVKIQEPVVEAINMNADQTAENTKQANEKLDGAIVSARSARKYKWYILFVCILIIAIVVAVPVGYCFATESCGTKSK
ncbi:hypothetical protein ASPWEDRAFT_29880 [Aspergillus wentii DTO 134E9]|uniref:t-SNARE coiled-coil homology domain-containing protein n=1 Tax=Aspergillus wentii DTO 134E9 TaxID=1073089 RepID=A0A1L9RCU5_ASPWE|nr:uncharacterized protein ASPWEDRAFT_29880 [Aspergillus wentii DTO 134E9]OJJ32734.1 hypothetical protein ASPWEDRAFT_29880 [Aspergillus wentii DTO 134E9]